MCCCSCCSDCGNCGCDCCVRRVLSNCGPTALTTFLNGLTFAIANARLTINGLQIGPSLVAVANSAALIVQLNTVVVPNLISTGYTVLGTFSLSPDGTQIFVPVIGNEAIGLAPTCSQVLTPVNA